MKAWTIMIMNLALLAGLCSAADKPDIEEEKDRIAYSVGYQVGQDFRAQGMQADPELLLKGFRDALAGEEPLMHPKEMRATLVDFKKKVLAGQSEQQQAAAEKNLAEGREFLAENRKKEGVTALPSGLQYRVLREGKGKPPGPSDLVTAHYRGRLIDGTEFDSSYHRDEPATFRADRTIKGWQEGLQLMKPGARYEFYIPPDLAYGERGGGSKIGPNRTLIFEVELLAVQPVEETAGERKASEKP